MKNLRTKIDNWFERLDERWKALPVGKQRRYTLLFFAGYLLLSVAVMLKVCYDVAKSDNKITIEHIENPIIKKEKSSAPPLDSIETILKKKLYER